ncbi:MAG: group 1 glycosyl transferase [Berkelbacteria bacterium GW2011_GWE1_39_12]|uniref:Group 1 glycosyl transferase n=1 Tax=Berkelbacteria bacterium GW2011_GWE1_39_12 TaxID=1618337 RepID=A0A0G4B4B2_9BACT|nr:MAG: group 1 glycosyl transferase [Berkelbacteria bacterium GW2011_GWE1_39_12]
MDKLKIAVLAPLTRPIENDPRGARARIVYDLVKGLVEKGHEVTTFCTGNSTIPGKIVPIAPVAVFQMDAENPFYQHMIYLCRMMDEVIKREGEFDLIHSHLYPEVLPITFDQFLKKPLLVTPHQFVSGEVAENYKAHSKASYIAVSNYQVQEEPQINFIGTVHNGVALNEFDFNDSSEDYLLFFGRMKEFVEIDGKSVDPKGVTNAIKIAQKAGMRLKIAGNVESQAFFDREIKPYLGEQIEFVGPIDSFGPISVEQKVKLYKNAKAFLFPINLVEAFGMTMLESMACGTPVIGSDLGATSEAIIDGKTGFLVPPGDIDAAVAAAKKIDQIDRKNCRKHIEENFTVEKMVAEYEGMYQKVLKTN